MRQGKGDHENWYSPIPSKPFTVDGSIKKEQAQVKDLKVQEFGKKYDFSELSL